MFDSLAMGYSDFHARRTREIGRGFDFNVPAMTARARTVGPQVGSEFNLALGKELGKFNASAFFSAESAAEIQEYMRKAGRGLGTSITAPVTAAVNATTAAAAPVIASLPTGGTPGNSGTVRAAVNPRLNDASSEARRGADLDRRIAALPSREEGRYRHEAVGGSDEERALLEQMRELQRTSR